MKKKSMRIGALLLCVLLLLSVLAGCRQDGGDETGTGAASEQETDPIAEEKMLEIIGEDRTTRFLIVRPDAAVAEVKLAASGLFGRFSDLGIKIDITTDWEKNPQKSDYEILIGHTTREKDDFYTVDRDLLGEDGYLIKVVGTKIILCGGSDKGTVKAVEAFMDMIPEAGKMEISDRYEFAFSESARFSGIKSGGVSLGEFQLVIPEGDNLCRQAAELFRKQVFSLSSVIMEKPVSVGTADHQIRFDRSSGEGAVFEINAENGNLSITGTERAGLYRGIRDYFAEAAEEVSSELSLDGTVIRDYGEVVMYEDFGAKGDGKTDDIDAIAAAHEKANSTGTPVFAREDAEYYIGGRAKVAVIKTDVDWSCARFVIDDTNPEKIGTEIFNVSRSSNSVPISVTKLSEGQTNIGVTLPCDCLVTAQNSNVKHYIREGANQNDGAAMTDIFLVHPDGSVDPSAPIMWDFDTVTSISAIPVDEQPLTIRGGIITTIANQAQSQYNYHYRGIRVYRSNVTFDGLEHYVTGEGSNGAPYYGILIFHSTVNDVVKNVTFTGHKTYKTIGSAGTSVSMGSYDITVTNSLNFKAENCRQTNEITDSNYWGVFASNYSKNIEFDHCSFSRFDAHQGVYNVTLKDCSLGHQGINLIGRGTALVENCTVYAKTFVNLRSDYGSTWNGDLVIRNCTYIPNNGKSGDAVVIGGSYNGSHDFGYTCYLPKNVIIDGLDIRTTNSTAPSVFANINSNWKSDSYVAKYPMVMTEHIRVKNVTASNGKALEVSSNKFMFKNLVIEALE